MGDEKRQETLEQLHAATERQVQQTSAEVAKLSAENAKTSAAVKDLTESVQSLRDLVGGQEDRWGKIVESLVAGSLTRILAEALNIKVNHASTRVKGICGSTNWEIDVLAVNQGTVVPVEVKTTLRKDDIDDFVERILKRFTKLIPAHRGDKVYGAVAYVRTGGNEDRIINYATSKGLIVIKALHSTNKIVNATTCQLHDFNPCTA